MTIFSRNSTRSAAGAGRSGLIALGSCLIVLFAFTGAGCKSVAGPDYKSPDAPQKADWVGGTELADIAAAKKAIEPNWWHGFSDPYLNQLIDRAIDGDFNLKILALRLEQAGLGIEDAENLRKPTVNFQAGGSFQKQSGQASTESYTQSTGLNWELDIWGKAKKAVNAKEAEYKASEADWRAAYLTLVSSVATRYFEILQFDEQIRNQAATLEHNEKLLRIYTAQLREGLVPESRLLSQRAEINTLQRDRLELERQRREAEFTLATLIGVPAGSVKVPGGRLTDKVKILDIPAGLPSELLKRRPDILSKEYRVLAAHNLLGEARLAQLPKISLTASAGSASNMLSSLLKTWTFGLAPSISIPIFDPSIKTNIKSKTVDMKVAEEEYRSTVVKAYEEVETALLNVSYRKQQKEELRKQIANLRVVRNVQYAQLEEGLVSQLEVFETDRSLLGAQQSLLTTHQQILADMVNLYKALGGGWPAEVVSQE